MNIQGSQLLDPAYFAAIRARVQAVPNCQELERVAVDALDQATGVKTAIAAELAILQPILSLLEAPEANPAKIVTWIENYIAAVLTPYVAPVAVYAAQLAALEGEVAALVAAVEAKSATLGNCSLSLPGVGL